MKFSIRLKLLLFTFSLALLVAGSIAAYSVYHQKQYLEAEFSKESLQAGKLFAESLVNPIYFLDMVQLKRSLESARGNPNIEYINISDANGESLVSGPGDSEIANAQKVSFNRAMLAAGDAWISTMHGANLDIGGPIRLGGEKAIGYLHIRFSLSHIQAIISDARYPLT
jgi:sensor histidine kinase regulating citrate/malate metabolism